MASSFWARRAPKQERARSTVEAVLIATERVLVEEGFEKATTNGIAKVAGVSVGSLYQYFPNKEALLAAVVDRRLSELEDALVERLRGARTTRDWLEPWLLPIQREAKLFALLRRPEGEPRWQEFEAQLAATLAPVFERRGRAGARARLAGEVAAQSLVAGVRGALRRGVSMDGAWVDELAWLLERYADAPPESADPLAPWLRHLAPLLGDEGTRQALSLAAIDAQADGAACERLRPTLETFLGAAHAARVLDALRQDLEARS